jgi:hypothetical protein
VPLHFSVVRAKNLAGSAPYVSVYWLGKCVGITDVVAETLSPEWTTAPFVLPLLVGDDVRLRVVVRDKGPGPQGESDNLLGQFELWGNDLLHLPCGHEKQFRLWKDFSRDDWRKQNVSAQQPLPNVVVLCSVASNQTNPTNCPTSAALANAYAAEQTCRRLVEKCAEVAVEEVEIKKWICKSMVTNVLSEVDEVS